MGRDPICMNVSSYKTYIIIYSWVSCIIAKASQWRYRYVVNIAAAPCCRPVYVYCTRGQKTQTVGDGNIHIQRQDIITTQSQSLPRAVVCLESYITLPQYLNWAVVNITPRIISHHNAILDTFFIRGEKLRLQIRNVDGETRPSVKNCNWSYLAAWQIVVKTDEVAWLQ